MTLGVIAVEGTGRECVAYLTARANRRRRCLALGVALLLLSAPALALKNDRKQPLDVAADRSESNVDGSTTTLTGNVEIQQGSLQASAARADVTQANGAVSRVVLTGSPARLSQRLDGAQGQMNGLASRIDYELTADRITLQGGVRLERPQGIMESEKVVYRVDSGQLDAGGDGNRVKFRIQPKADEVAVPDAAPDAASSPADGRP